MKRRAVLERLGAGALVGLAGCSGSPSATSRRETTDPDRETTVPDGLQRRVSIADRGSVPDWQQVRFEVRVVEPTITDTHTARVRITMENEGPDRQFDFSTEGCTIFDRSSQISSPRGLWLEPAERGEAVRQTGPRWIEEDVPEDGMRFPDYGCPSEVFSTGESIQNEYAVLHDWRVEEYLRPGTYRFAREVVVEPTTEGLVNVATRFTWGFALAVEDSRR